VEQKCKRFSRNESDFSESGQGQQRDEICSFILYTNMCFGAFVIEKCIYSLFTLGLGFAPGASFSFELKKRGPSFIVKSLPVAS